MKIHGVRIYPQSTDVLKGTGATIFVHGRVREDCSDFYYIFGPLAALWRGRFFADSFVRGLNEDGSFDDPLPELRTRYGAAFLAADLESQLMLLRGDGFSHWGAVRYSCEGDFLPLFTEPPGFELLKRLYWDRDFVLGPDTWPDELRAVLHMWDDIYWQLFSRDRGDIDLLIRTHANDPKLKLFFVDFVREYPDPSNGPLEPATLLAGQ